MDDVTTPKLRPEQRYAQEAREPIDEMIDLIDGIKLKAAPWDEGGARVPEARFNCAVVFSDMLYEVGSGDLIYAGADIFDLWPVHSRAVARWNNHKADSHAFTLLALDSDITNVDGTVWPVPAHEQEIARILAGQSLHMQYQWTVAVRAVGSNFTLRVPTTPTGARKLLSLRDVEPGRERRRALKHWVNAHTRRMLGRDSEKDVDISAHLRGATPFKWDDLEGEVRPSPHDLKMA